MERRKNMVDHLFFPLFLLILFLPVLLDTDLVCVLRKKMKKFQNTTIDKETEVSRKEIQNGMKFGKIEGNDQLTN